MLTYLLVAAVVVVLALFVMRAAKVHGKLFATDNYREVVAWLPRAKAEAIARADEPPAPIQKGDPRLLLTGAGLLLFYTVRHDGDVYRHHISASLPGRVTPHAVGRPFVVFVAERLGWDLGRGQFFFSPKNVFHGEIELDEEAHRAWAERPVDDAVTADIHSQAFARRDAVTFSLVDPAALAAAPAGEAPPASGPAER